MQLGAGKLLADDNLQMKEFRDESFDNMFNKHLVLVFHQTQEHKEGWSVKELRWELVTTILLTGGGEVWGGSWHFNC